MVSKAGDLGNGHILVTNLLTVLDSVNGFFLHSRQEMGVSFSSFPNQNS